MTVIAGDGIEKSAALTPAVAGVPTTDTLTLAFAVPGPVTVQAFVPEFKAVAKIVLHVAPPSRESSIFIAFVAARLTDVQVIL